MNALVRAEAACRVALGALPQLPEDVREAVSGPLTEFCNIVGRSAYAQTGSLQPTRPTTRCPFG
jgi:hypothetical protein